MAQESLMKELKASLATHARSATFACGGSIPINLSNKTASTFPAYSPVQVRFGWNGLGSTLNLPGSEPSSKEFEQLLKVSLPATFARAGKEVLGENYRKAGKLDRGHFSTDFCPYEVGIVDTLTQILLPQTKQSKHVQSIKADLYKLNVYSAPSGMFKPHVDTPRSESQLGSLVVSLPSDHEGGQLAVRNAGNEALFDWSKSANSKDAKPCIKWAAFYSDCEHEVLEVTSGHRITLTYNLYVTRGLGHLAGAASALDATTLPLYKTIKSAIAKPSFFSDGQIIAVWLTHAYAHTSKDKCFLPESLKGADMSVYETALALNLRCAVVPIIPDGGYDEFIDSQFDIFEPNGPDTLLTDVLHDDDGTWGQPLPVDKVTWVNHRKDSLREAQTGYAVYGNDSGQMDVKYSNAALLIRVPPFKNRDLPVDLSKRFWAGMKCDGDDEDRSVGDEDEWLDPRNKM